MDWKDDRAVRMVGSFAGMALVLLVALAAACGSPDDGTDMFTFEPAPYTTLESGTPIAVEFETCALYPADQVLADVEKSYAQEFASWAEEIGFRITFQQERFAGNRTTFSLAVPVGSVPDAVRAVREQPGVINAGPNYLQPVGPKPTPPPPLRCADQP